MIVACHDILGKTALVDLAGLRDAIAQQGGDPAQVNPVVPTQLIVDLHAAKTAVIRLHIAARRAVGLEDSDADAIQGHHQRQHRRAHRDFQRVALDQLEDLAHRRAAPVA